jgi:diguanylate cyclase (GGDEF)-like protein
MATDGDDGDASPAELRAWLAEARAQSRRAEDRATALTGLAHELSGLEDTAAVTALLAAALPRVLDSDSAAVWLWDAERGEIRATATAGLTPELHEALLAFPVRPEETPELAALLARREPLVLNAGAVTPVLETMLAALGLRAAIGVALLSGRTLLGAATAAWVDRPLEGAALVETTARLQGIADHGATALQNARLVEEARHQALHDGLTGLPNRVLFLDRLEVALRGADGAAVLFCDLDRFKLVNDEHGHRAGDEVLRQVAARLREAVRPGDLVARLGGDEFGILLPGVADEAAAREVAEQVTAGVAQALHVDGRRLRLTTSVGLAVAPNGEGPGDLLLQAADAAMYLAKRRGLNQIGSGSAAVGAGLEPGGTLLSELRAATGAGELRVVLQPVHRVRPGGADVVGAEALVRWQHPRLGLLAPAVFVPLAERHGCIVDVDLWVLRVACREAASWPGDTGVAVNLSVRTLADPRLDEAVRRALVDHGLAPGRLHLEVVESRALLDLPNVVERLRALRHLGLRIALDDFGTGFSTLHWLKELPVDRVKVDRSFTVDTVPPTDDAADLRRGRVANALLRGILALGRELGIDVVAEGVETPAQLAAVQAAGCTLVQGFLLGRPGPPEELRAALG